jgi:solute carrier family 8 (sodium/calcium exchanger)
MAAMFTEYTEGGEDSCVCEVKIVTDGLVQGRLDTMYKALKAQQQLNIVGYGSYWEQIVSQVYVNGSKEDQDEATASDWALHVGSFPWKMLFALIPPTDYCQGWLCFVCSLGMIGLVTAFVGDLASLLGCSLNIPDDIAAITLVALGTSLPDTFASKTAAQQDPYADASIGNVTGSNSVNVFLGLGMPWTLGALYWEGYLGTEFADLREKWLARVANRQGDTYLDLGFSKAYPDGAFIVPAGSLAYSVSVFTSLALITVLILLARRLAHGGELGGPTVSRYVSATALVGIWFIYIAASIHKSMQDE